jgi:cobalt/nickel transport system permease protein
MHLEEFAEGSTVLHRLDPRTKFIAGLPLLVSIALMKGLTGPMAALCLGVLLTLVARLDMRQLFLRLLAVNAFVLMLWVFLPFTTTGETVATLGPLTATREGLAFALSITLKTNAIALLTISVFGTTEAMSLAHALVHMKVPAKLVHLFFFFYRYLSVLHEEYTRLRQAMRLRSFRARGGAGHLHTYRSLGNLLGMLLVRSHERSSRIYNAMLCRGFHGHFPVISHFHFHMIDLVFGLTGVILAGGMLALWH